MSWTSEQVLHMRFTQQEKMKVKIVELSLRNKKLVQEVSY